jgi:3-oxoadipate enol-lactonase
MIAEVNGIRLAYSDTAASGHVPADARQRPLTRSDAAQAGPTRPDTGDRELARSDAAEAGLTRSGAGEAGLTRSDAAEAGLTRSDAGEAGLTHSDAGDRELARSDAGEAGLTRSDTGAGELARSDAAEAGPTRSDTGQRALTRSDTGEAGLTRSETGAGSPVVLLVHGFVLNRSMWDPQLGTLKAAGARVIAPDLRGFGASEAGPPGPLTMEQHADDLAALLDVLGVREPVVYVGLSMGGYAGFAFWQRFPSRVRGLVLADTRATADSPEHRAWRLAMAAQAEAVGSSQPAIDGMLPQFFSWTLRPGSVVEQTARRMVAGTSARAVADGHRGMALRPDSTALLGSIDVPTLVIVGEHDVLTTPADARLIAEGVPGARLVSIDQAGHLSNMENPEAFNEALLSFLRQAG